MNRFCFCQSRESFDEDMPSAEDIDDDRIDKVVHSYDMCMDMFLECFQLRSMEYDLMKSFLEIFGIYLVGNGFRMMFALFEEREDRAEILVIFLQKEKERNEDDDQDNNQEKYNGSHTFLGIK